MKESQMEVLHEGLGELVGWHDPDENREFVLHNKSRALKDKTMSARDAVAKFVKDGDFIASGGFGHIRVSMNIIYEIIRQRKRDLTMAGKTAVHDLDLLATDASIRSRSLTASGTR
jgi:predicted urease superfamily metal-dependent hydrolase